MKRLQHIFIFGLLLQLVSPLRAQVGIADQFRKQAASVLQEKLYLHTDKDYYAAGEICWFKIYNVEAGSHMPLAFSSLAYAEILDNSNKPVLRAKIALNGSEGNGSFFLPLGIASGTYKLRAYTNWMKNFDPGFYFEKHITVINTRTSLPAIGAAPAPELAFFPEGGDLVAGLESRVAFRIRGGTSDEAKCRGVVLGAGGDTVAYFSSLARGMGSFRITPRAGEHYSAAAYLPNGTVVKANLPEVRPNGIVMEVKPGADSSVSVFVRSTEQEAGELILFVQSRSTVKAVLSNSIHSGMASFVLRRDQLGDGISQLTLFNAARQPIGERLWFSYPRYPLQAEITTNATEYNPRSRVQLNLLTMNYGGLVTPANCSIAVYRSDSQPGATEADINSYLLLTSDLPGRIDAPTWYFQNSNDSIVTLSMDHLMMTNGWRRFKWQDVLNNKSPLISFVPERNGHIVTGRITRTVTGTPIRDAACYLSVPGTRTQFKGSISDSTGKVVFELRDFYNMGEVIVQTDNYADSTISIDLQNPFSEKYTPAFRQETIKDISEPELRLQNTVVQVQNEFNAGKMKQFSLPLVDSMPFYYTPDVSYLLDNYTRFTTMEEVLREYVTPVNVRKQNGRFHLPVYDEPTRTFFDSDPLVLLDGVPLFDFNRLLQYDPLKVKKLDVVSRRYFMGNMAFEGIVNFITYKGNMDGFELDPHTTVIDYQGLQLQREFYSPDYSQSSDALAHLPDYRQLLFWSADASTGKDGKRQLSFYTSDIPGRYTIVLQGIAANGQTISKTATFEIKEPPAITGK